jgi:hypothetical protein
MGGEMKLLSGLSCCPRCKYPLTGLACAGRCPECGFEYDEATRVWVRARRWSWLTPIVLGAVGLFPLSLRAFEELERGFAGVSAKWWLVLVWIAGMGFLVYCASRFYRANRLGSYIAITSAGIETRLGLHHRFVRWSEISAIEDGARLRLKIHSGGGLTIPSVFSAEEEHYFVAEVRCRIHARQGAEKLESERGRS